MTRRLQDAAFHQNPPVAYRAMPWFEQGLCRQTDPDDYYPEKRRGAGLKGGAKGVCRRCPVRTDCLEYALAWNERHGIWGGLTVNERRALAKQRAKDAA